MKKLFFAILYTLLIISLSGCKTVSKKIEDTTEKEKQKLSKWLNKPEEDLKSFYGQPDKVKPKQGRLGKLATAAAANPAAALVAYDLGKGIIGKISTLRAPAVVGGKAGFRSAGGYQAT